MNRIYQGKVTTVEISDGNSPILSASNGERNKGEVSNQNPSQPFDLDVLPVAPKQSEGGWRHHELFQDAVNY